MDRLNKLFVSGGLVALVVAMPLVTALASYNMPPAVTAMTGVDEAMTRMETAVPQEVLADFKKAHPAPFWLFGEDRQLAVRNNIVPVHWFVEGFPQHGRFSGIARPGEFYLFQVCVLAGGQPLSTLLPRVSIPGLGKAEIRFITRTPVTVGAGEVKPVWIGIQVPPAAKSGEYHGVITVGSVSLELALKVEGSPIAEDGTSEAWRLARLKWLDSSIGDSETVVPSPFTPIRVSAWKRTLDILGRRITLGDNGIPSQYESFFSASNTRILDQGKKAFLQPAVLSCTVGGKVLDWKPVKFKFTKSTPVGVEWRAVSRSAEGVTLTTSGRLEFDGYLKLSMALSGCNGAVVVDDVRFATVWDQEEVKYAMGLGLKGGACPDKHEWRWDTARNQDCLWLGDVNAGVLQRFKGGNFCRPLINAYYRFQPLVLPDSWGGGGIGLEKKDGVVTVVATSGARTIPAATDGKDGLCFDIDWYFTPFKPLAVKDHFADRIYHAAQGAGVEDTAALHADGARIVEVHHNRLCNPYINYPFNDDSIGELTNFVKKAHGDGIRVNLYYTTRELTQNLPEFFALKSLDGEVILKRKEGVAWPVTNQNGPHPWLRKHVGMDIVPAWRENLDYPSYKSSLDLAMITTPDSRWNNFYLEGLDYLVKKAGIDGLYIDDTALDRKSMQRARRILDADGNNGRRVNMHSWNHFNDLSCWTSSSLAFMELYPYYNGLWLGEGFSANASPDYMLVEMSGIPFGLMSEMLEQPNAWHGYVFGMRTRWPWSGDPRALWKMESEFGIEESEFIGWWDPACPVRTGNDKVKASVFRKKGKTLIALGSWAGETSVALTIDWASLGLNPATARLRAPEIKGLQAAAEFKSGDSIPLAANQGMLLICEQKGL